MAKRRRENEINAGFTMCQNKPHPWSDWREAMVPWIIGIHDRQQYSPRAAADNAIPHYYRPQTLEELATRWSDSDNCCGIYELAIEKENRLQVVYIGSTCRNIDASLRARISEYLHNGSHIRGIIENALNEGFRILVRWLKIRNDLYDDIPIGRKLAKELENEYLKRYDYAWNKRLNNRRRIIRGIDVVN